MACLQRLVPTMPCSFNVMCPQCRVASMTCAQNAVCVCTHAMGARTKQLTTSRRGTSICSRFVRPFRPLNLLHAVPPVAPLPQLRCA
jgi:hypothetical protein